MSNDYSRDETEWGSFGDVSRGRSLTALPTFGGLFDIFDKVVKKPVQAKVSAGLTAQGASPAQVNLYNAAAAKAQPTAADIAKGVGKSAVMLAPIVAPVLAPALLPLAGAAIAPAAQAFLPVASKGASLADQAHQLTGGVNLSVSAPKVDPALAASAVARGLVSPAAAAAAVAGTPAPAAITPTALNSLATQLSVLAQSGKNDVAKLRSQLETMISKVPQTADGKAAIAAARSKFEAAAKKAPTPVAGATQALLSRASPTATFTTPSAGSAFVIDRSFSPQVQSPYLPVQVQPSSTLQTSVSTLRAASDAVAALIKYLVLDSGQVLSDAAAQQKLAGFAVLTDGRVVRQ